MVAVGVVSLICIHGSALQDIFSTGVQYMSGDLGVARAQDKLLGKKKNLMFLILHLLLRYRLSQLSCTLQELGIVPI